MPYAVALKVSPRSWLSTMTTPPALSEAYCVQLAIRLSATPVTTRSSSVEEQPILTMPDAATSPKLPCLPDKVHHWMISEMHVHYEFPKAKGKLLEDSVMRCKHCGGIRKSQIQLPYEYDAYSSGGI